MKISVMVPVLNGEKCLEACLSTICSQDVEIHEYIIIDNNSTDGTKKIIEAFQKKHSNIVYVFEPLRSRGAARNTGVVHVTGEIIAMTDADCVVPTDWVRRLTEPIVQGQEKMVGGGQYDTAGTYWSRHMQKTGDHFMETAVSPDGYVVFCDTKNFAIDAGLMKSMMFDYRFKALENVEFDYRMRPISRVKFLPEVMVGHRNASTLYELWRLGYSRAFWYAQLYHKFRGLYDIHGVLIFPVIPARRFYLSLLKIPLEPLKVFGISHILFMLVFECATKCGSAMGFYREVLTDTNYHTR